MVTAPVLTERIANTMLITLNRPEVRNAVNLDLANALGDAVEQAEQDADVRVVVLTGAGPAFCSGADLKALSRGEAVSNNQQPYAAWGFAGFVSHPVSKPTIAAVNGYAVAGGTELVLACDLAIASESARFGLPEVKRGLVAAAGGVFRLPQQIPRKLAMELILTGDELDAQQAQGLGLVNAVVPDGNVVDAALALATRIEKNAPLAVQASKAVAIGLDGGRLVAEEDMWRLANRRAAEVLGSSDAREGATAFVERRDPIWQGR